MKTKNLFFTSDLHVGHAKVIEYDSRPFGSLHDMHKEMIERYNSVVTWDSVCYFLGDVGVSNGNALVEYMNQLNGTKVLIRGNHDAKAPSMYEKGFDVVLEHAAIVINGELVTLSHYPLVGVPREDTAGMRGAKEKENWHGEGRHQRLALEDKGQFHLHGHIHSSPTKTKSVKILGRQYDVGVPANEYTPVSRATIESWIAKTKNSELLTD